ncbi:amidohydrolase [Gillisia sp. M10.2A]|uniref:Amidohydrolase n=1 Tax=Gillisia lutea TaxID=2909668 RepID=A0ABS9EHB0_9FLAO|nr:amidohydrolase [Gillisia lutea]MCF4101204.1 amidohydrolase [Gillisia lutea]
MLSKIQNLRKELHQYPELSGEEMNTAKRIKDFIIKNHNTQIIENLGGNGVAAVYNFSNNGLTIIIRCELDALPIQEENIFKHRSKISGVSHKCGHDGHMAIVAGLIFWVKKQNFQTGRLILLFQPAEENGKGAQAVLNDEKFKTFKPDYIFALHNIPGEPLHSIITTPNNFSATVQSLIISLNGKECHASEPEKGINPALGIAELVKQITSLNVMNTDDPNFSVLTPVHINMGQKFYGISPGTGELHYTLRTWSVPVMNKLYDELSRIVGKICKDFYLEYKFETLEYFPTTINSPFCNKLITEAAKVNNFTLLEKPTSFRFGEDFGWFSQKYKSAMFGIGAGINSPALHHSNYDFPEDIIDTGMKMFETIISKLLK